MGTEYQEKKLYPEEIVIRPPSKFAYLNLGELIKYRHMLWSMVWRDIRLQFDTMYLGFFWAIARPLAMVTVFTFLKRFSGANTFVNISYPLYVYSGLILWFHFLEACTAASKSVVKDAGLIKKIYFPRLITPIVPVISGLYTLGLALVPLVFMMIWEGMYPSWRIALTPIVLLQCMVLSVGVGAIVASLSLENSDYEKFLYLILYVGLFVSPVIFSPDMIPTKIKIIYFLNPMAGTLLAFRSCMFDSFAFPYWQFLYSMGFSALIFAGGMIMYRRAEIYFSDKL